MLINDQTLVSRQAIINVQRKRLLNVVTAHKASRISNCGFRIYQVSPSISRFEFRNSQFQPNGSPTPRPGLNSAWERSAAVLLATLLTLPSADCPALLPTVVTSTQLGTEFL